MIYAPPPSKPEVVACMPAANADTLQQLLRKCRVKVDGTTYVGLFPDAFAAIDDATDRHPNARGASAMVIA